MTTGSVGEHIQHERRPRPGMLVTANDNNQAERQPFNVVPRPLLSTPSPSHYPGRFPQSEGLMSYRLKGANPSSINLSQGVARETRSICASYFIALLVAALIINRL